MNFFPIEDPGFIVWNPVRRLIEIEEYEWMQRELEKLWPPIGDEMPALLDISIPGEPRPKTRPRFVRGLDRNDREVARAYSDQKEAQKKFAWEIRVAAPKFHMRPKDEILSIGLVFNTTSKSVDIDNLVKFVLDAGNGFLWENDRQIVYLAARLNRVESDPSVEIVLHRSV